MPPNHVHLFQHFYISYYAFIYFFYFILTAYHGQKCIYEGDIIAPSSCESCRCVNGTYECYFIEGCEEESSEYMLKEIFDNDRKYFLKIVKIGRKISLPGIFEVL